MKRKYRVGVLGFAHLHVLEIIRGFLAMPDHYEFIGAADTAPMNETTYQGPASRWSNRERFLRMMNMDQMFESMEQLLETKPDLVLVTTENALHGTVIPQLLYQGIHVVTDKPLAICKDHALKIEKAAREGKALCITNWFSYWKPGIRLAKKLIDQGIIGKVYRFQYRNPDSLGVHPDKKQIPEEYLKREWWYQLRCGGGSMIDYCSYGIVLADWFLGRQPETVFGIKANFHHQFGDAEDYAALTLTYPEGVAFLEGTWATRSSGLPTGPIVWGDKGSLIVENYDHKNRTRVCVYQEPYASIPNIVYDSEDYPLPQGHQNLAEDVFYYLETGEDLPYLLSLDCNVKATYVLEAGIRSAASGKLFVSEYELCYDYKEE